MAVHEIVCWAPLLLGQSRPSTGSGGNAQHGDAAGARGAPVWLVRQGGGPGVKERSLATTRRPALRCGAPRLLLPGVAATSPLSAAAAQAAAAESSSRRWRLPPAAAPGAWRGVAVCGAGATVVGGPSPSPS